MYNIPIMENENKIESIQNKYGKSAHYHGDVVRKLFILGAIIMVVTLPFLSHRLPTSPFVSILIIILLGSTAGFISPKGTWVIPMNFIISAVAVLAFEYYAIDAYTKYSATDSLFLTDQALAIIFLFALYYSAKTFRAKFSDN